MLTEDEKERRHRVVKGWVFRDISEDEVKAIRSYLKGGPVPPEYAERDKEIK